MRYTEDDALRFWSKVDKTEGCWNWTAYRNERGYGTFGLVVDGKRKIVKAHRLAFVMETGGDIGDVLIDHRCHNRSCVRPSHLRTASPKQNQENLSGRKRQNTSGVRGVSWASRHQRWLAKVTHNQKQVYVGLFDTVAEAENAVIAKRNELFTHNELDRVA
jgi:hypothetical protein